MDGGGAALAETEPDAFTEAELAELAMSADPAAPLPPDAVCLWELEGWDQGKLLPTWYMPAPARGRSSSRWQRSIIGLIVASFLLLNGYGLCSTYGSITFG